ncbi:hypothetical protein Tco_0248269 [Tanacetum coccineum]
MYIMTSRPRTRVFRPGPVWACDRLVFKAKVIENQVMAAPVISILSDSSKESVGSHAPRVILFGTIPAIIPYILVVPVKVPIALADPIVAPEVGAVSVISPTGVLDLVDYSSLSNSDPSEDSLPSVPELPLVSPFLRSDDSEADYESEPAEQRPERHESLTPSFEFPLALVVASPKICQRQVILVRPGEAIPFDLHGDVYLIVLRIVILYQILLQAHLLLVHLCILQGSKHVFECLDGSFTLSIGLGMICRTHV